MHRAFLVLIGLLLVIALLLIGGAFDGGPKSPPTLLPVGTGQTALRSESAAAPTRLPATGTLEPTATAPAPQPDGAVSAVSREPSARAWNVPFVLVGRCVRAGAPQPDREIELLPLDGDGPRQNLRTDADGAFRRAVPGAGRYRLTFRGDDLSRHQQTMVVSVERGVPCDLGDVPLRPVACVRGAAVDDRGPIAGAAVQLSSPATGDTTTAATAADGTFAFADVADGAYVLRTEVGDALARATVSVRDGAVLPTAVQLRLRAFARLTGVVRDDDDAARDDAEVAIDAGDADEADDGGQAVVHTDADGRFALRAARGAMLSIRAPGCRTGRVVGDGSPLAVVLQRLRTLRGVVVPQASAAALDEAWVELRPLAGTTDMATAASPPGRHPVADDGSFAIADLVRGRYWLAGGAHDGAVPGRVIELPLASTPRLELLPGRPTELQLHDDRGEPLPFGVVLVLAPGAAAKLPATATPAELGAGIGAAAPAEITRWRADDRGRVLLAAPPERDLIVAVEAAGILPAAARWTTAARAAAADRGAPLDLVAVRASVLRGRVTALDDRDCYHLAVAAWRQGEPPTTALELPIGDDGTFRSAPLAAGRWHVALVRRDTTARGSGAPPAPHAVPLLAGGIDGRTTAVVDAPAGGETELLLPAPEIACITGRVLRAGRPVADVAVHAVPLGAAAPGIAASVLGFDAPDVHALAPHTVTDGDGAFRLLVARPGAFELRARHPSQPVATPPTVARVTAYGARVDVRLQLPAGGVRGELPAAADPAIDRALLYPAAAAAADPFARTLSTPADADVRLRLPVGPGRTFAFVAVPPGAFVLRLCAGDRIALQQFVRVHDAIVDLGPLQPPTPVRCAPIALQPGTALPTAVHVLAALDGIDGGAFQVAVTATASVALPPLPPGRYLLRWPTAATPQPVAVLTDGRTEPVTLTPPR